MYHGGKGMAERLQLHEWEYVAVGYTVVHLEGDRADQNQEPFLEAYFLPACPHLRTQQFTICGLMTGVAYQIFTFWLIAVAKL